MTVVRSAASSRLAPKGAGRSKSARTQVSLVCEECKSRNYRTSKRREQRLEIKKFCKHCGHHTVHQETK